MNTNFPKASAEERDIMSSDSSLSSSWWELYNEKTGRYYWNVVTNVTQYEKPRCMAPQGGTVGSFFGNPMECAFLQYWQASKNVTRRLLPPPNSNMEGSSALNILPSKEAHVPSFTTSMGDMSKDSLYLSFVLPGGKEKWYYLNLSGEREEKIVKESGLKPELITTLLDEPTGDSFASSVAVNSSIYRCFTKGGRFSPTSCLQVLDIKYREGLVAEFMLAKARHEPRAVHMGGKIYVVGPEFRSDQQFPRRINDIEVFTVGESSKWETIPLRSPKLDDWYTYFVVGVEDQSKLVFGTRQDVCLFVYDVCTHHLERIGLHYMIPWSSTLPPVAVGNVLFSFFGATIFAFDLVERSYWYGMIEGLDGSFFQDNCNEYEDPRLIYLGGGKLCLICLNWGTRGNTSILRCCLFDVPEFREQAGYRSLHGCVQSVQTFYIEDTLVFSDVLLI